ncbi:SSU ribosomal protein S6P [Dongia mobilis]|uniref:Small ribosomal subunit protein bS6 n=1 Tax=Dongia mobilis TaxID=578943 RepID=A0A4R6WN84_9PROT|nr:30S ribosomal protein S6 [Dongia mobilis]TDQ82482.1 SSU ribosomal protein S6P [Dongia mobilis]
MPFYENVFIARQDVTAQQVDALAEAFTGIVTAQGGQVLKKEYWGLKGLTYRINKNRKGHFVLFNIDAPAGAIAELERNMRLNEDVLRYLTVRVDELEAGPSAMLQSKGRDRDERGGRGDREGGREGGRFGGRGDREGGRGDRDDRLRPGRDRDRGERVAAEGEGERA